MLLDISENTNFDVMIEYGETEMFTDVRVGFAKNGASENPTESGEGTYGLLGTGSVDGVFATYWFFWRMFGRSRDYLVFSHLDCCRPIKKLCVVTMLCKMESYWKDCPEGDNVPKMTYWIRY